MTVRAEPRSAAHHPGRALAPLLARALRARWQRARIAIAGVATGVLLVLMLFAAFRNPSLSVSSYVSQPGVDLWVLPHGTDNLVRTGGFLPAAMLDGIAEVPGVVRADPILRVFVRCAPWGKRGDAPEQSVMLLAIGYRVPGGLGGPPLFASGRAPVTSREVAIDRAAAHRLGVRLGDSLNVNGQLALVSGLTRATNLMITQMLFFDESVLEGASGLDQQASFIAIRAASGDAVAVAARVREAFPGVLVLDRLAFERNSLREAAAGYVPVLTLVTLLGVFASALLIALLVQGVVEDRRTDLAVLLALGAGAGALGRAVILQAIRLVALGCVCGLLASGALALALDQWAPSVQLAFQPGDVALAVSVFALAGMIGAAVPVMRLARVDPLEAFRS